MHKAEAAGAAAQRLADRLTDPGEVAAVMHRSQAECADTSLTWQGFSLGDGHAGVAFALAGLGDTDERYLTAARHHLRAAVDQLRQQGRYSPSLYVGLAGLGYAAGAVARRPGDCAQILDTCTATVSSAARALVRILDHDGHERSFHQYDVIEGLSGLSRFLLERDGPDGPETVAALTGLVRFVCPPTRRTDGLPPWLVHGNPALVNGGIRPSGDSGETRLLDLGMAHGVAGVLSVLAIAKLAGARIPHLEEAVTTTAGWLAGWHQGTATGRWPTAVWPSEEPAKRSVMADRMAWCYGTPGVAAALCLAGRALGRADLTVLGREAIVWACESLEARGTMTDMGVCHGWAGIAAILMAVRDDAPSPEIDACLGSVIDRMIGQQDEQLPFLHRYPHSLTKSDLDDATFLTGAAGTATILFAYSQGGKSSSAWRDVLMLG